MTHANLQRCSVTCSSLLWFTALLSHKVTNYLLSNGALFICNQLLLFDVLTIKSCKQIVCTHVYLLVTPSQLTWAAQLGNTVVLAIHTQSDSLYFCAVLLNYSDKRNFDHWIVITAVITISDVKFHEFCSLKYFKNFTIFSSFTLTYPFNIFYMLNITLHSFMYTADP